MSNTDQNHDSSPTGRRSLLTMPENHLDIVVTAGSIEPSRTASTRTVLGAVIALPLFFLLTLTIAFVSAGHAPKPHDMALTIAGSTSVTDQIAESVADQAPNAFNITQTISASDARDAVKNRDAVGAVIIDGQNVTTVIASGGGKLATSVVQTAGQQIASSLGGTSTIEDVAPLPPSDPGGTVLFFLLVICTVGGFLPITAISQAFPKARTRSLVATAVGSGIVVPVIGFAVISIFVDYQVNFGTIAAVLGVGMIYCFTVGMLSTLFTKLLGNAAIFLQILILVALNFPSAGGTAPESMLPPFWQVLHNGWLGSGAFESMRGILFFDGGGVGHSMVQLLIWTAASIVLTILVAARGKRTEEPAETVAGVPATEQTAPVASADASASTSGVAVGSAI